MQRSHYQWMMALIVIAVLGVLFWQVILVNENQLTGLDNATASPATQLTPSSEKQRVQEDECSAVTTQDDSETVGKEDQADQHTAQQTFKAEAAGRTVTLMGFTRARTILTLVSEEEGRCVALHADIGDTISTEGVIAVLDTTFIALDLEQNQASQAKLRGDVAFYSKEKKRYADLVERKTAAQSTLDSHVRNETSARQELRVLRIEEERLKERLERHTLRAPAGWQIISRNVEVGEWVNKGQAIATVGRYDVLLVPYALALAEFKALEGGKTIPLHLPELGLSVEAEIARVSPGFDAETRKINVDLEIIKGDFSFRGGIRTELRLELPDTSGSVYVPETALVRAYEEYFLLRPDGVRVKVMLLGSGPKDTVRVAGEEVRSGDSFIVDPTK